MRVLYVATDQVVPGPTGGATHVRAVAEGLARRGHVIHVLSSGDGIESIAGVSWSPIGVPLGRRELRLARLRHVIGMARAFKPDVIVERYYNFGGEGMIAGRQLGALRVLEVNSPAIDHPGSVKRVIDAGLLFRPMRRWREWQFDQADVILTPSLAIIPPNVTATKLRQIEWGVDVDRFVPNDDRRDQQSRQGITAVFVGAFQRWHGAAHLVRAMKLLHRRGRHDIRAVLIGTGPELDRVRREAAHEAEVTFTGALPHDEVPARLAAADIGVAPFDPSRHAQLQLDFYWSPLKVFEYMASGLPVITPDLDRLRNLVGDRKEGLLYRAGSIEALANCLTELADHPETRLRLGRAARARAVASYSWAAHCRTLEEIFLDGLGQLKSKGGG